MTSNQSKKQSTKSPQRYSISENTCAVIGNTCLLIAIVLGLTVTIFA